MAGAESSTDPSAGQAELEPRWPVVVARAWRKRCPRCGEQGLFASFFRLDRRCVHCQLVFRPEAGGMTGQMYLSAAVTELVAVVLAAALWFGTGWSIPVMLLVAVPLVVAFSFWFLPKGMALWVAVDYLTDRHDQKWTPS